MKTRHRPRDSNFPALPRPPTRWGQADGLAGKRPYHFPSRKAKKGIKKMKKHCVNKVQTGENMSKKCKKSVKRQKKCAGQDKDRCAGNPGSPRRHHLFNFFLHLLSFLLPFYTTPFLFTFFSPFVKENDKDARPPAHPPAPAGGCGSAGKFESRACAWSSSFCFYLLVAF